jgi:hypothetical protein
VEADAVAIDPVELIEGAHGFAGGLAFAAAAVEVGAGLLVVAAADAGDGVERVVGWAVASADTTTLHSCRTNRFETGPSISRDNSAQISGDGVNHWDGPASEGQDCASFSHRCARSDFSRLRATATVGSRSDLGCNAPWRPPNTEALGFWWGEGELAHPTTA